MKIPEMPPPSVTRLLRLDAAAVAIAAIATYAVLGGNWWLFALLILAPDLSMVGYLAGPKAGAWSYNIVHSYALPIALAAIAYIVGAAWLVPFALIWIAHIALDRVLGYGLKYPEGFGHTHLGLIGPARKESRLANAR